MYLLSLCNLFELLRYLVEIRPHIRHFSPALLKHLNIRQLIQNESSASKDLICTYFPFEISLNCLAIWSKSGRISGILAQHCLSIWIYYSRWETSVLHQMSLHISILVAYQAFQPNIAWTFDCTAVDGKCEFWIKLSYRFMYLLSLCNLLKLLGYLVEIRSHIRHFSQALLEHLNILQWMKNKSFGLAYSEDNV